MLDFPFLWNNVTFFLNFHTLKYVLGIRNLEIQLKFNKLKIGKFLEWLHWKHKIFSWKQYSEFSEDLQKPFGFPWEKWTKLCNSIHSIDFLPTDKGNSIQAEETTGYCQQSHAYRIHKLRNIEKQAVIWKPNDFSWEIKLIIIH